MAVLPNEVVVRSSVEAARSFVESYYQALNEGKPVAASYVNASATYREAGHPPADICINGLVVATPEEWDRMLAQQRHVPASTTITTSTTSSTSTNNSIPGRPHPAVRYNVECFDVHVINQDYRFAAPPAMLVPDPSKPAHGAGARIMMSLTVSGTVFFGSDADSLKQHFSDVFILVPNWDAIAKARTGRRYLVASHTYRAY